MNEKLAAELERAIAEVRKAKELAPEAYSHVLVPLGSLDLLIDAASSYATLRKALDLLFEMAEKRR